jgi:hypothetical protein
VFPQSTATVVMNSFLSRCVSAKLSHRETIALVFSVKSTRRLLGINPSRLAPPHEF